MTRHKEDLEAEEICHGGVRSARRGQTCLDEGKARREENLEKEEICCEAKSPCRG